MSVSLFLCVSVCMHGRVYLCMVCTWVMSGCLNRFEVVYGVRNHGTGLTPKVFKNFVFHHWEIVCNLLN